MPSADANVPGDIRVEHDMLDERDIPADAYWGVHTLRAAENFPITGRVIGLWPELVRALVLVKHAAAQANYELGLLDEGKAKLIVAACREIASGALHDQFVVDQIQGGAGTSTNMNANEVIANRALELGGRRKGDYAWLHPIEHVNNGTEHQRRLSDRGATGAALRDRGPDRRHGGAEARVRREIGGVPRSAQGRAHAAAGRVPMTLGQEFSTFAVMLGEDQQRLHEAGALIEEVNLGATAIGTGINSHPGYAPLVCKHLVALSGIHVKTAENLVEATQDCGAFVQLSGVLKRIAVKLSKTCNDLRLLSSGPRAGLGEIVLPAVQAGSSIMPGKVNPVIPEVVNHARLEETVRHTIGIVTALNPYIGYEKSSALAREAHETVRN